MWADCLSASSIQLCRHTEPDNIRHVHAKKHSCKEICIYSLHLWRCTQLSGYLKTLKASSVIVAWEKLFISCGALHSSTAVCCPPLSLAGTNKGLTGRAWRSWLLDGKGESHSWAGQASSLAKVMSCVHWDSGWGEGSYLTQMFFSFLMATWFGEEKSPRGCW